MELIWKSYSQYVVLVNSEKGKEFSNGVSGFVYRILKALVIVLSETINI